MLNLELAIELFFHRSGHVSKKPTGPDILGSCTLVWATSWNLSEFYIWYFIFKEKLMWLSYM